MSAAECWKQIWDDITWWNCLGIRPMTNNWAQLTPVGLSALSLTPRVNEAGIFVALRPRLRFSSGQLRTAVDCSYCVQQAVHRAASIITQTYSSGRPRRNPFRNTETSSPLAHYV